MLLLFPENLFYFLMNTTQSSLTEKPTLVISGLQLDPCDLLIVV